MYVTNILQSATVGEVKSIVSVNEYKRMENFSSIENDKDVIVIMFGSLGKENFFIMKDTLRNL